MINVTELRSGVLFSDQGQTFIVVTYEHVKQGRGSGNVKLKARNVKTGATVEKSFMTGARVDDVSVEKKKASFLYSDAENAVFMDDDTFEQFEVPKKVLGESAKFLKEGMPGAVQVVNDEVVAVDLPKSVELKVTMAGAGIKGNSVSNVWKKAELENGISVDVPLFIKDGDMIRIDTREGTYMERVK